MLKITPHFSKVSHISEDGNCVLACGHTIWLETVEGAWNTLVPEREVQEGLKVSCRICSEADLYKRILDLPRPQLAQYETISELKELHPEALGFEIGEIVRTEEGKEFLVLDLVQRVCSFPISDLRNLRYGRPAGITVRYAYFPDEGRRYATFLLRVNTFRRHEYEI